VEHESEGLAEPEALPVAEPEALSQALEVRAQKGSVLSLAVANYGAMAINAATGPIMARVLGPGGRGAVAAISVWDEASSRVFYLGLPDATGYRTKEGLDPPGALLGTVRRVGLWLFPIAVAAGVLVAYWPLGSLDFRSKILVVVLVGMSPLVNTFGRACYQMLMVERDLKSLRVATLIVNTVGFVVIITAVIFGALDVWVAALALALGRFAEHGYAWWRAKVKVHGRAKLKPMLAFGVKAIPGSLTDLANNRLDQLFIIPFLGFKALGFYAVAVTVNFIPFQIGTALSSSTYGQVRVEAQRGQHGVTSQLIRRGFVTTGAAAIAVAIATPTILPLLYGQRFDPSVGPTLILLPGTIAWSLTLIATQIGNGINKPQYGSIAQIAGVVVTITGLIIMVPRYGVAGAAIVSTITYATRLIILLTLLRKNGITGTTPRPADITWLYKRTQRIATRPLRAARQGKRPTTPPPRNEGPQGNQHEPDSRRADP
jgi:O-antigen/teichoic acid export membrane protein